MSDPYFDRPILNSPYEYPARHWELDDSGQPTQQIVDTRRSARFITPIPKPRKRKGAVEHASIVFDIVYTIESDFKIKAVNAFDKIIDAVAVETA